jgi:hypothetical protein
MKIGKKSWRLVLLIPFVITGCFILFSIVHYGVNTPFSDEWDMIPIFQKADHHTLGFTNLWSQHNEHRIFFPNIVLTLTAYATHWNIRTELLINFAFSLITALMLYLFVLTKIKQRPLAMLAAVLISAWFYSPVQYENWLWGWQLEWFMCVAGAVTTIYLLDRFSIAKHNHRHLFFVGAMLSAIIATFSLGSGMLVWLVGLGILALYGQGKKPIRAWLGGFILSFSAYYYHYHKPAQDPSTTLFLHHPISFSRYIFSYFGRPVSGNTDIAILVGSILIFSSIPVLYAVWLKRSMIQKFIPWLGLIALSLMAGFMTAVSRLGFGLVQSSASRYTAFSLLYIIGLTGLICALLDTIKLDRRNLLFIVLVIIAVSSPLLFSSYQNGKVGLRSQSTYFKQLKQCTHDRSPSDLCLQWTYPNIDITRHRLEYIKAKHWAGY